MQLFVYLHGDLLACRLPISMKQKENKKTHNTKYAKQVNFNTLTLQKVLRTSNVGIGTALTA